MNILGTRDQENLIHGQQRLAAAKPLNHGVKGLAPKTPGANNGGKSTLNGKFTIRNRGGDDENAVHGGKTGKAGKLNFVTPVAPRDRAPLGAKTTNVKAKAFQTPGPLGGGNGLQKTQRRTISAKKAKIKIHQPQAVDVAPLLKDEEDVEPEIEYCPPKPIELPDVSDDDFEPSKIFPRFDSDQVFRSLYNSNMNEHHARQAFEKAERNERLNARLEKELEDNMEKAFREDNLESILAEPSKRAVPPHATRKPVEMHGLHQIMARPTSTSRSKAAVAALSTSSTPRFAAPTQATAAKRNGLTPLTKPPARNTPGTAASRTTLGYASGRKASSTLKQDRQVSASPMRTPLSKQLLTKHDSSSRQLLFGDYGEDDDGDDDELLFPKTQRAMDWLDEMEDPNFRLELPAFEDLRL